MPRRKKPRVFPIRSLRSPAILPGHLKQSLPGEAAAAATVLPAFLTSYALFSVPAAFAVQHWGRKPIMLGGLGTVLASYLLIHAASSMDLVIVLANVVGLGWALVNTPALPMMLELVPAGRLSRGRYRRGRLHASRAATGRDALSAPSAFPTG